MPIDLDAARRLSDFLDDNTDGSGLRLRLQVYSKYTDEVSAETEGLDVSEVGFQLREMLAMSDAYQGALRFLQAVKGE